MNADQLREEIMKELAGYKKYYKEHNTALETTLSLLKELKSRFRPACE